MQKKSSLLSYLKEEHFLNDYWYDCLRYELDKHIYYYGDHFKRSFESLQTDKKNKLKYGLKALVSRVQFVKPSIDKSKPIIISSAYFNFNEELNKRDFTVIQPPWTSERNSWGYYNAELITLCLKIKYLFETADFHYLLSKEFLQLLQTFSNAFKAFVLKEEIAALIVPNDENFFPNIAIKIFKELHKPSFISLHGLPARYNAIDENRSDYLIVWGEKLKELYIKSGIAENKIFVSGHPAYKNFDNKNLTFSLVNVLVLTKTIAGSPHSDGVTLTDRGNLIVYLLSIQKVLKQYGVKHARLRPHPSENVDWYMKFVDKDFFLPDTATLSDSLAQASLVVGPVSSVFLEALFYKVNYLIYEPVYNGKNILNQALAPPFDGSDKRITIAYNEDTLLTFLKEQQCADVSILQDYFYTPFDVSFIKEIAK